MPSYRQQDEFQLPSVLTHSCRGFLLNLLFARRSGTTPLRLRSSISITLKNPVAMLAADFLVFSLGEWGHLGGLQPPLVRLQFRLDQQVVIETGTSVLACRTRRPNTLGRIETAFLATTLPSFGPAWPGEGSDHRAVFSIGRDALKPSWSSSSLTVSCRDKS